MRGDCILTSWGVIQSSTDPESTKYGSNYIETLSKRSNRILQNNNHLLIPPSEEIYWYQSFLDEPTTHFGLGDAGFSTSYSASLIDPSFYPSLPRYTEVDFLPSSYSGSESMTKNSRSSE